jgi:hypothetical protein
MSDRVHRRACACGRFEDVKKRVAQYLAELKVEDLPTRGYSKYAVEDAKGADGPADSRAGRA